MAQIKNVLEIINNLISYTADETVNIKKVSLFYIRFYLHDELERVEFMQIESQVQETIQIPNNSQRVMKLL